MKTPKHPFQQYYVTVYYCKPLTRAKVKEETDKLKVRKVSTTIIGNSLPAAMTLNYENVADTHVIVHWPTGVWIKGNIGASYVAELVKLDNLLQRYKELTGEVPGGFGNYFRPYEVPDALKIKIPRLTNPIMD